MNYKRYKRIFNYALDYVIGDDCWREDKCDLDVAVHGDGHCSFCDGPEGQKGFCCRGDNYMTGCTSLLQTAMVQAGRYTGHYCIYNKHG